MCHPSRHQQASSTQRATPNRRSPSCSCSSLLASCSSGQTTPTTTLNNAVQRGSGEPLLLSCMPSSVCISTWASAIYRDGTCTGVSFISNPLSLLSSLVGASSTSSATSMSPHRRPLQLLLTRCPAFVLSFSRCSTPSLITTLP